MNDGEIVEQIIETTCGRVLFNEVVPEEVGFINEVLDQEITCEILLVTY